MMDALFDSSKFRNAATQAAWLTEEAQPVSWPCWIYAALA